jgi:hypothetical protein
VGGGTKYLSWCCPYPKEMDDKRKLIRISKIEKKELWQHRTAFISHPGGGAILVVS